MFDFTRKMIVGSILLHLGELFVIRPSGGLEPVVVCRPSCDSHVGPPPRLNGWNRLPIAAPHASSLGLSLLGSGSIAAITIEPARVARAQAVAPRPRDAPPRRSDKEASATARAVPLPNIACLSALDRSSSVHDEVALPIPLQALWNERISNRGLQRRERQMPMP